MKAIIACAGSGGHINPGIAIANVIKKNEPNSEIIFVGTKTGMENDLVKKAGYNVIHIRAGRFLRQITWYNIRNMIRAGLGVFDTMHLIDKFKPDIIIGTGGFICVPVMKGAKIKKVPYVLHESNAYPGLSVKVVAHDAKAIFTGFEDTCKRLGDGINCIYTGTPAKFDMNDMVKLDKNECLEKLKLDKKYIGNRKIIFVTGGSQGAIKFNSTVIKMIKKYKPENLYFVLAVGPDNYEKALNEVDKDLEKYLRIEKFVYEMDKMYKASDMLITRAGALTITELSIVRRAAILIPLPTAAENHQYYNAKAMENAGAGIVLEENVLNEDTLYDKINKVVNDEKLLETMSDNAAKLYKPNVEQNIYLKIKELVKSDKENQK